MSPVSLVGSRMLQTSKISHFSQKFVHSQNSASKSAEFKLGRLFLYFLFETWVRVPLKLKAFRKKKYLTNREFSRDTKTRFLCPSNFILLTRVKLNMIWSSGCKPVSSPLVYIYYLHELVLSRAKIYGIQIPFFIFRSSQLSQISEPAITFFFYFLEYGTIIWGLTKFLSY